MADEPLRNPRTGQLVTRIVKAKHRDLEREVVMVATREVVTIKACDYDPTMHGPLDMLEPAAEEQQQPAKPKPKRKRRTRKKK